MNDLISRQAAIDALKSQLSDWNDDYNIPVRKSIENIEHLPSAQPEIVRCKDCENWIPGYITDKDVFIPPKCGKYQQMVGHSSDDYCSLAERRTDESNVQDKCYSDPAKPSIFVHSSWSHGERVELEVGDERYTVDGEELISAIKRCMLNVFGK